MAIMIRTLLAAFLLAVSALGEQPQTKTRTLTDTEYWKVRALSSEFASAVRVQQEAAARFNETVKELCGKYASSAGDNCNLTQDLKSMTWLEPKPEAKPADEKKENKENKK